MRISNFSKSAGGPTTRVQALVTWEDSDRSPLEVFFETDSQLDRDLEPRPDAFLLAATLPAFRHGEERLWIDGSVCPRLVEGLETAMTLQRAWHDSSRRVVAIEPARGKRPETRGPSRAGLFLTCGVDSLHMLRRNRRTFSASHPASFRDAIYVEGLSFPENVPSERNLDLTRRQRRAVAAVAAETDLALIPVRTNLRLLDPEHAFVAREAFSSVLAAVAHVFARRVTSVSMAAALDLGTLRPWGTNPLLDPGYCSAALEFLQEGWTLDRVSKVRELASWKTALDWLSVCFEGPLADGRPNCGACEKCLRTMAALVAVGASRGVAAFPPELTPAMVERALDSAYNPGFVEGMWTPLVRPLREAGRPDLSRAVSRLIASARRRQRWLEERDWKGRVRRLDRNLFGGVLLRASRRLRGIPELAASP